MQFKSNFNTILFLFLVFVMPYGFSQTKIKGRVLDQNKQPIPQATIIISNATTKKGAVSMSDGSFSVSLDKQGTYDLEVSFIGYASYKNTVTAGAKPLVLQDVVLQELVEELQSVEVLGRKRKDYVSDYSFSATKTAIKNKELPQAVATVTKELIADRQAFQLVDAVKTVSSVSATGLYNHFNIRGITQADDGQVVNGMRTRQYYFLQPITSHLERVEVIKGPSSVTFSSADPGGTVNMVTKKPLKEKRSEVSIATGSFGTLRTTADFTGPLNDEKTLLYRFNAAYQEANSFRDVVNNNTLLIAPSFSYIPDENTALNVELIYNNADGNLDRGQPIFDAADNNYNPNSTSISLSPSAANDFYKTKELTFMASFNKKFADNFGFNAKYMKQTWDEDLKEHRADAFRGAYDATGAVIPDVVAMRYAERQQNWDTDNFSTYFNFDIKSGAITNKTLVGYDATRWERVAVATNSARDYLLNDGTTARFRPGKSDPNDFQQIDGLLVPAVPHLDLNNPFNGIRNTSNYVISQSEKPANLTTSNGIYLQNQFKIGKFSALFNLRYEWFTDVFDYNGANEQTYNTNAFVPRLGLTYELTKDISLYTTYLEGFQPHTNTVSLSPVAEGFFWEASPGKFDPLESSLKEFGAKGLFFNGKLSANVALYEITQKNLLMGDYWDLENLELRGEQQSKGIEADVSGYILDNFRVTASYAYNDAKIIQDNDASLIGQPIGGAPKHNANFWGRYDFTSKTLKGIGLGFGAQYSDEKYTWYRGRVLLPEYTIFDAALYYKPSSTGIELSLKLNNISNKTYWLGGLSPARLAPGAPRNILLQASYKF